MQVTCKLFYFVQNLTYSCSVLILTLISLERYMAIKHPMLNRRFGTPAVYGVVIGGAWLLSGVYSLPWLVAYDIVMISPDAAYCFNTLPLNTRVYAMINFVILYVVPLVFMTFLYVRISITLWRSSNVMSLPFSLRMLPPDEHHHHHHHHRDSGDVQYLHHRASRTSSRLRLYLNNSSPNSPHASARSSLRSNCSRSPVHNEVVTQAAERHLAANELALPVTAATSRRSTSSYINERRMTQDNFLTSRRKVVRLLAAIVVHHADDQ